MLAESIGAMGISFDVDQPEKRTKKSAPTKIKLTCESFVELNYALRILNSTLKGQEINMLKQQWNRIPWNYFQQQLLEFQDDYLDGCIDVNSRYKVVQVYGEDGTKKDICKEITAFIDKLLTLKRFAVSLCNKDIKPFLRAMLNSAANNPFEDKLEELE